MCHQTVSLAARHLEAHGIPTVIMGCAKDIVEHCGAPRFLFSDFPLGNSAGRPNDLASQDFTLTLALKLLEGAPAAIVQRLVRDLEPLWESGDVVLTDSVGPVTIAKVSDHDMPPPGGGVVTDTCAVPTAATDGTRVHVLFGTGELAALDFDGRPVWIRSLAEEYGPFRNRWGMGASPILVDGLLVENDQCLNQCLSSMPCPSGSRISALAYSPSRTNGPHVIGTSFVFR